MKLYALVGTLSLFFLTALAPSSTAAALDSAAVLIQPVGVRPAAWSPDATVVASGGTVTWTNLDFIPHQPANKLLPSSALGAPAAGGCFDAGAIAGVLASVPTPDTASAVFTYDGATVTATVGATTQTCAASTFVPVTDANTGFDAVLIPYYCEIHGDLMWGGAVVVLKG